MDMDTVRPSFDVRSKTGFHRVLYGKKLPRAGSAVKAERRMDELRYPWNYTVDNIYRPSRKAKRCEDDIDAEPKGVYDKGAWTASREIEGRMATDRLGRCFDDKGKPFTHALTYRQRASVSESPIIGIHKTFKRPTKDPEEDIDDIIEEFRDYEPRRRPIKREVIEFSDEEDDGVSYIGTAALSDEDEDNYVLLPPPPPPLPIRSLSLPSFEMHPDVPTTRDTKLEHLVKAVFRPRDREVDSGFRQLMRTSSRILQEAKLPSQVIRFEWVLLVCWPRYSKTLQNAQQEPRCLEALNLLFLAWIVVTFARDCSWIATFDIFSHHTNE